MTRRSLRTLVGSTAVAWCIAVSTAAGAGEPTRADTPRSGSAGRLPGMPGAQLEGRPVDRIEIIGNRRTQDYVILRELRSEVSVPHAGWHLADNIERLDRLDIFSEIDSRAELDGDELVIRIEVKESFPWLGGPAITITDENGVSAGLSARNNNVFGRNIFAGGRVVAGGSTSIELTLANPWAGGNHNNYKFDVWHRERENAVLDFFEVSTEVHADVGTWIGRAGRAGARGSYISLNGDRPEATLTPGDDSDSVPELAAYIGIDNRNLISNTTTGWWSELELRKSGMFGSAVDHWLFTIDLRRYLPIGNRHAFALFSTNRLRTGTVGVTIAPWQAYFLGGTNSVRGWRLAQREGKSESVNTVEYRFTLINPRDWSLPFGINYRGGLQLAVFGDAGIVWNEHRELALDRMIGGYGIGARILLPMVGVLRLDVGRGQPGEGWRFHIAAFEKPVRTRLRVR